MRLHVTLLTSLLVLMAVGAWAQGERTSNEIRRPGVTRNAADVKSKVFAGLTKTQRRAKLTYLWKKYHAHSYSPALVERWCAEHERYGIADLWYISFCNMAYASCLRPNMSCRGGGLWARGLCDCTQLNGSWRDFRDIGSTDLFNPHVSIRNHCIELAAKVRCGYDYWEALRAVFLPGSPNGGRSMQEQYRWSHYDGQYKPALAMYFREARRGYAHVQPHPAWAINKPEENETWRTTSTGVPPAVIASSVSPSSAPPQ